MAYPHGLVPIGIFRFPTLMDEQTMRVLRRRDLVLGAAAAASLASMPAAAAPPALVVRGAIDGAGPDGRRVFDLAALRAMPQKSFRTTTPWHKQAVTFTGVPFDAFLRHVGAKGTRLRLIALNDYAVIADIPELTDNGALLALAKDGVPLPVADKGPIFVVFPFDRDPKLRTDNFYLHSVWQLCQIDVL